MSDGLPTEAPPFPYTGEGPPADREQEQWRIDKRGREYIPAGDRRGVILREGDETTAQARERDARARTQERRPRKRAKVKHVPEPPREPDLKELEHVLTEALKQPGLIAAGFGDTWAADHFITTAPAVSRNLVVASQYNPWLRRKLEDAASGQDAAMAALSLIPLTGAIIMYLAPPIIYFFDLPIPEGGRRMLGDIPHRNGRRPDYAAGPDSRPSPPPPDYANTPPRPDGAPFPPPGTGAPPPQAGPAPAGAAPS